MDGWGLFLFRQRTDSIQLGRTDRAGGAGAVDFAGWMRAVMRTVMRVDDEMLGKKIRKKIRKRNGYVQGI